MRRERPKTCFTCPTRPFTLGYRRLGGFARGRDHRDNLASAAGDRAPSDDDFGQLSPRERGGRRLAV